MFVVDKSNVELIGNKLVAEASTIGLRPGEWPDFVAVIDKEGKGFLFGPNYRDHRSAIGNEFLSREYFSRASQVSLDILND